MEYSDSLQPIPVRAAEDREETMNLSGVNEMKKYFRREKVTYSDPNVNANYPREIIASIYEPNETDNVEEIMIMDDVNEMMKHFLREKVVIWYDPNVHSPENIEHMKELEKTYDTKVFTDWKEASEYLKKETQLLSCHVITSGTYGEVFVQEISNLSYISSIYVFDSDINNHKTWINQFKEQIKCAESSFARLLEKMRHNMSKPSLRTDLPSFSPIFDDMDLSEMNYLHFYLKGLINFKNRAQAKKDFLSLARALYKKSQDIDEFEKSYNQYDMKTILNWYTKESFLYKLTNNCLRLAKSDSILYCRLVLKDLETAVKDKYKQQSHKFSGLLYRGGAYLSDNEWTRLQQNINRDIEMHGFLSTSKKLDIADGYCQEDMDKKAIITIIVPNFPDKGEQGFAEMIDYTDFSGEEEVLFNVRSRFTVLEATLEETNGMKIRHLVLLYGAQAMRRFIALHNPSIEVEINRSETKQCAGCNQNININKESSIAVSICSKHQYFCKNCIQQPEKTRKLVLLCVPRSAPRLLSAASEKNDKVNLKIEGTIIPYQDGQDVSFYGVKCVVCEGTKLNCCGRCLDCKDEKKTYCNNCFHDQSKNNCIRQGHVMVLQGYPFGFWSDKMSKMELQHSNYQKEQVEKTSDLSQQGNIFYETHNYEKAIQYFQKYLDKNSDSKNEQTASCHNNIGIAYNSLGDYHKATENLLKSLEINKAVFGNDHSNTAASYNNLGNVYSRLGDYEKALEYYSKSLKISKAVLGDNHPSTGISYHNLGEAYRNSGKYQEAIEFHKKSLEINKVVFGDTHPSTATSYLNLGNIYDSLGEYQKAIEHYSKSLKINKAVLGDNHPSTGISYHNLGEAYRKSGKYQEAIEYYFKSLEINKSMLGDSHSTIATCYNNLGLAYGSLGEYQKALDYYTKSLGIRTAIFGDRHNDTATSYLNLGNIYNSLGEYQKAIEYYSKSLEINKAVFGDNHASTAASYNSLGTAYESLGHYQAAFDTYSKSLQIRETVLRKNHPDTATSYNNLGSVCSHLELYQEARKYYSKSLEINKAVFGDNHASTAASYNSLGTAYESLGHYQAALDTYSKSLQIRETVLRKNHPDTAASCNSLGHVYYSLCKYQKAIEYFSKSLNITKAAFGDYHPNTAASYNNLGGAYGSSGDYQKAIEYCSKSLEINKQVLGDRHPDIASIYFSLGQAHYLMREYQKTKECYSEAFEIAKASLGDQHSITKRAFDYFHALLLEQAYINVSSSP